MADDVYDGIYSPFMNNPKRNRKVTLERMYLRILTELSVNRFKWVGLPDTVDERFLEMTLYYNGLSIFYFDKDYERYMAVRGSGSNPNVYDNPTRFNVLGQGAFKSKTISAKNAVPIWSNYTRVPDHDIVYIYATKLAEIDRTIEINLQSMRYSHIVFVDENERQSYMNVIRQHREGQPVIFGTNSLDPGKIQAFNVGIDKDVVLNLQISKGKIWNECMTLLGIKNANEDKRERMVVDEVNANEDQVASSRGVSLNARSMAADQINRLYDLSVSVGWNEQADASAAEQVAALKVF